MSRVYVVHVADPYPADEAGQKVLALAWLKDLLTSWETALHPASLHRWLLLYRPGICPARFPMVDHVPDDMTAQHGLGQSFIVLLTDVRPPDGLPADQVLSLRVSPRDWPTVA